MVKKLWLEQYPTRNGIAIPAYELELTEIEDDLILEFEMSNHHDCWAKRKFGRNVLYSTLRDLEICQSILPNSLHRYIHNTYEPPDLPRPYQAYTHILKAANNGAKIKTGTANKPEYKLISDGLLDRVHKDYKLLKSR